MSPHAAKARGIYDRATAAPIAGHEGMPDDSAQQGILRDQALIGSAHSGDKGDGLMSDLNLFEATGSNVNAIGGEGSGAGDDELTAMAWPGSRLVRSASMSSTGSGEAEESEVSARLLAFHATTSKLKILNIACAANCLIFTPFFL